MAFTDLPDDWTNQPITTPGLTADVLDLLASDSDRASGAILVALCDDDERLVQPFIIDEIPHDSASAEDAAHLTHLLAIIASDGLASSVLVGILRPGGLEMTPGDNAWCEALETARWEGMRLLGVHVVTPTGSRRVRRAVK